MKSALLEHIEHVLGLKVASALPVSGGDISSAFKLNVGEGHIFCKYQTGAQGYPLLKAEKEGLEAIGETGTIKVPEIIHLGEVDGSGILLMEYIEARPASEAEMKDFGERLARLHMTTSPAFGWETANYIGSLPQPNDRLDTWAEFYATQRLIPQFNTAKENGLLAESEIPGRAILESRIQETFRPAEPSLIHGDLWGGNYLITASGEPCLIDPSISFSHPGMDLGMSRLFGGFSSSFYQGYQEVSPYSVPDKTETDMSQLYYLLVHLNLFGSSYASSVRGIIKRYF